MTGTLSRSHVEPVSPVAQDTYSSVLKAWSHIVHLNSFLGRVISVGFVLSKHRSGSLAADSLYKLI